MGFIKIKFKIIILLGLQICSAYSIAQSHKQEAKRTHKYQLLEQVFANNKEDTIQTLKTAQQWLATAKKESNNPECVNAYKIIMHYVPQKYRLIYADSLLQSAKATHNNETIAAAHVTIGLGYYNLNNIQKALDQHIQANSYAIHTNDLYLKHKIKYTIAQTKYQLEYYNEAIALFTESLPFFKEENETAYLKTLHSLSMCYIFIERYDLSAFNIQLGLKQSTEWENDEMIPYFQSAEGINEFQLKNYEVALNSLQKANIEMAKQNDYNAFALNLLYVGKCFWSTNQKATAVGYFIKLDQLVMQHKLNRPNLRENYALLLHFYTEQNNRNKRLIYAEKLMAFDKEANTQFKYASYRVHKEYDTNEQLLEKQELLTEMINSKKLHKISIAAFFIVIMGLVVWHFKSRKRQQNIFNQIMSQWPENREQSPDEKEKEEELEQEIALIKTPKPITVGREVTAAVMPFLDKFEKNKMYLDKDISLVKLASYLHTNTKYTSLIIAEHRGKNIPTYIRDLKVDYIVDKLKKNELGFRKFTNEALAKEAGFGSTQIFTKAFIARMKLSPTYFIKELKKIS